MFRDPLLRKGLTSGHDSIKSCGKLEVVLLAETCKSVGQQRFVCIELHLDGIKQGLCHLLEGFPTKLEYFL